jgi:hypothetical protein
MLDHLDRLDDTEPPTADAGTLAGVHARANTMRRRSRLTNAGAVAAVVLAVAGVVAIASHRDREVKVIAAPSTLTVHLEIPKTAYAPGDVVNGTIVFDNPTNRSVDYTLSCTLQPPWQVLLSRNGTTFEPGTVLPGCIDKGAPAVHHMEPGTRRQAFGVGLQYWSCGSGSASVAEPVCVQNAIPPLAAGTYQLVFRGIGPFRSVTTAPVSIEVR